MKQSNFDQFSHQTNLEELKYQFQYQFPCKSNDMKCWYNLLPTLPCDIEDKNCWKRKYPQIPCSSQNQSCWRRLLPNLPCKLSDKRCWQSVKINEQEKILINRDPVDLNTVTTYEEKAFDPMRYMERQYGGNKSREKDGDRWIV